MTSSVTSQAMTVEVEVDLKAYPSPYTLAARIAQKNNPGFRARAEIRRTNRTGQHGGTIFEVDLVAVGEVS